MVALITTLFAHLFTISIERKKHFLNLHKALYSKAFPYLTNYLRNTVRYSYNDSEIVVTTDPLDIAFDYIEEHIEYASPNLLNTYEQYLGTQYQNKLKDRLNEDLFKHLICYYLMDDMLKKSRFTNIYSLSNRKYLKKSKYSLGIYCIAMIIDNKETAQDMIAKAWSTDLNKNLNKYVRNLDNLKLNEKRKKKLAELNKVYSRIYN